MSVDTLFDPSPPPGNAPLAVRMRPTNLAEVVGQPELTAVGSPVQQAVTGEPVTSLLLCGPPGTGKTTLAHLVAAGPGRRFVELSAVAAGVREVRQVIDQARVTRSTGGCRTVLFIDEVHRFSKAQQDALLPAVENGWVTLVAATTENPYFTVTGPLLSRLVTVHLRPLPEQAVRELVSRALTDRRGLGGAVQLAAGAVEHLVRLADGDARRALTALEAAADAATRAGARLVDLPLLERAVDRAAVRYDRDGDQHYDVTSALIKSVRGGDVDAGLHYLARMLEAGEDPRFVARRLVILASEDVGQADPGALPLAVAAAHAVELVGLPEARLALAQAVVALALAPKSNAVTTALDAAVRDVRAGGTGPVPDHLRDPHHPTARAGPGRGYRYPHDYPGAVVAQQHAPGPLAGREYYRPTDRGAEAAAGRRLAELRKILRAG